MDLNKWLDLVNISNLKFKEIRHGLIIREKMEFLYENSSIFYVTSKYCNIKIKDMTYKISSNCLCLINRNEEVFIDSLDGEAEYYVINYDIELPSYIARNKIASYSNKNIEGNLIFKINNSSLFKASFSNLYNLKVRNEKNHIHKERYLYSIISDLIWEIDMESSDLNLNILESSINYINHNYHKTSLIKDLADFLSVSRSTIYSHFIDEFGISPNEYVIKIRMDLACHLLIENDDSISQIAFKLGFKDPAYFSRIFKYKLGLPPSKYREKYKFDNEKRLNKFASLGNYSERLFQDFIRESSDYLLIDNMGMLHRYYKVPERIVCLDYACAEICIALGMANKIVGVASAEYNINDCSDRYKEVLCSLPFIHSSGETNVPELGFISKFRPEIIIGTSYSFREDSGIGDPKDIEKLACHIFAMTSTYKLGSTFEDFFLDIDNLGKIFKKEDLAKSVIEEMKLKLELLDNCEYIRNKKRVFVFDSITENGAITSAQSLENHIIEMAGGENVFGNINQQFLAVDWKSIARKKPEAILVHSFSNYSDGIQKISYIKKISELKNIPALKNNKFMVVPLKKVFPSLDSIDISIEIKKWLDEII